MLFLKNISIKLVTHLFIIPIYHSLRPIQCSVNVTYKYLDSSNIPVLDSTAKIPSGILRGNGNQLGDYDQCMETKARVRLDSGAIVNVHGKYCLAQIDLKPLTEDLKVPVHLAQARNFIRSNNHDVSIICLVMHDSQNELYRKPHYFTEVYCTPNLYLVGENMKKCNGGA